MQREKKIHQTLAFGLLNSQQLYENLRTCYARITVSQLLHCKACYWCNYRIISQKHTIINE